MSSHEPLTPTHVNIPFHRLDRETSGVLLCARTRGAASVLSRAFAHGAVRKEYVAICEGASSSTLRSCLRLHRQALHAPAITLPHPQTGQPMRFWAPWPADLRAFMC